MTNVQCRANTKKGERCKNSAQPGHAYCHIHAYLGNKRYMKTRNGFNGKKYVENYKEYGNGFRRNWRTTKTNYNKDAEDPWMGLIGLILFIIGLTLFIYANNGWGFVLGFIGFLLLSVEVDSQKRNKKK